MWAVLHLTLGAKSPDGPGIKDCLRVLHFKRLYSLPEGQEVEQVPSSPCWDIYRHQLRPIKWVDYLAETKLDCPDMRESTCEGSVWFYRLYQIMARKVLAGGGKHLQASCIKKKKKMKWADLIGCTHGGFPGDMIQAQRCWQGMKSDILPAPEVGQTEGAPHTHTHLIFTAKIPQSSNGDKVTYDISSAKIESGSPCTFISSHLCTHTHLTVIRRKGRRYGTSVKPSRGNGTFLPARSVWHGDCALLGPRKKKKLRRDEFIAPPEGMTVRSPRRLFSPVCKLWDTCVAMWRTELAGLPEIANPLSSEMSCVAWPRTSQAAAQPRSQALSPHYRLLSWLGLPGICRQPRGEYNLECGLLFQISPCSPALRFALVFCGVAHQAEYGLFFSRSTDSLELHDNNL